MKAVKLTITPDSKVAKNLKLSYKGKDLSACVTEVSFYLCDDTMKDVSRELIENSHMTDCWHRISRKEMYRVADWVAKKKT